MSLDDWRIAVGDFAFVGMNLAVVFSVERAVLGVEIFRCHREREVVFLRPESDGVVAAFGVDHALRERSGMNQLGEGNGKVAVVLIEKHLSAHDDARVGERGRFGIRTGWIAVEFRGVTGSLGSRGRGVLRVYSADT